MSPPGPIKSVMADAPPSVPAHPVAAKAAAKLELDGDELVQLSIKPSAWFIPLASLNVLLLAAFLAVALAVAMRTGSVAAGAAPFQLLALLVGVRLGLATLQWASRLYVLTNRRVMRFRGVLNVQVAECRLSQVTAVEVDVAWYGRALRLATLRLRPVDTAAAPVVWEDVARPQEIHEILIRAVRKAQS